jgi:pantoate--beta-alanine ligase
MARVWRIADLRTRLNALRTDGKRIGLVPTMGALHGGHQSLISACASSADIVVTSIFVNPLQFGPTEDYDRYPRNTEVDLELASASGSHICFTPEVDEMYGSTMTTSVDGGDLAERWEGAVRPGHFAGVLTVVAKLLSIVRPDIACFSPKDFQQAALISAMVRDLNFPVKISVLPTLRDADGLALSSRHVYLEAEQRRAARAIPRSLATLAKQWRDGERSSAALVRTAEAILKHSGLATDYAVVVHRRSLEPVDVANEGSVFLVAARAGRTRLIDNVILDGRIDTALENLPDRDS